MTSLEAQFHEAMLDIYRQAVKECRGYRPRIFLGMVVDNGGLETARRLLQTQEIQYGFDKLWECVRLDLTVEHHVLQPRFAELFGEQERQEAERRLRAHGYSVDSQDRLYRIDEEGT